MTPSPFLTTGRLARAVLAGALFAGAVVAGAAHPAQAAPSTTTHDPSPFRGMMPPSAPDAAATSSASRLGGPVQAATTQPTGVDVSHWQHDAGPLSWTQVAASGQKFAVMKATEVFVDSNGQLAVFTDPYVHSDLNAARAAGLVVGAYTFAHPKYSAVFQADAFASAIGVLPAGSLPPVLDLEDSTSGLSPAQLVAWTHAFLNELQARTNIVPMIYAGPSFWSSSMGGSTEFTQYPLWEAHYTTDPAPRAMGGWATYSLWQFTSSASVPGITGAVDQDRFNSSALTSISGLARRVWPSAVSAGGYLTAGKALMSPNLQYTVSMQSDGNLVVTGNGRALMSSRTGGHPGAYLAVQNDGNMVIYSSASRPLWYSRTGGAGAALTMQDDGNLVLTIGGSQVWANGAPGTGSLEVNSGLQAGQYLHSPAKSTTLTMQSDGNLVLYRYGQARWATGTNGHYGARLVLQSDGNLVVYDGAGNALWASRTAGRDGRVLSVQADGNLVLYSPTRPIWATYTND